MGSPDPARCVKATHRSNPDDSPVDCDADHTQSHLQAMPQRPGVLTLPMVPITNYAARVLTARAAASNTPHRPDGRAPAYLLPSLLPASPATPRCAHALAAVDDHGRTRPGSLLTALGWTASTILACRAAGSPQKVRPRRQLGVAAVDGHLVARPRPHHIPLSRQQQPQAKGCHLPWSEGAQSVEGSVAFKAESTNENLATWGPQLRKALKSGRVTSSALGRAARARCVPASRRHQPPCRRPRRHRLH
jgi:hypothetical protein